MDTGSLPAMRRAPLEDVHSQPAVNSGRGCSSVDGAYPTSTQGCGSSAGSFLRRRLRRATLFAYFFQRRGGFQGVSMIGTESPPLRLQTASEQGRGLVEPSSGTKKVGEVDGGFEGSGIVSTHHAALGVEALLEQ